MPGSTGDAGPRGPGLNYQRTLLVSPLADPVASGTALRAAFSSADAGSGTLLIKLEPGVYDIGNSSLLMGDGIDVEGSGEGVTLIQGSASSVIHGANAELRGLSVLNTSTNAVTDGVDTFITTNNFRMTHVTVTVASDGGSTFTEAFSGNGYLRDCTLRASGGTNSYGIYSNTGGNVTVVGSVVQGTTLGVRTSSGVGAAASSQIIGGGSSFTCVNCYNGSFGALNVTCN